MAAAAAEWREEEGHLLLVSCHEALYPEQARASSSGIHFDVQAPKNIRVSSDNSGMGFADGVNSHTAYDSVRSSGLDEDTETLMIMDPIECSLLSPSEVDKFGYMIANEMKLQRSTWKYLAMESKAACTREQGQQSQFPRREICPRR